MEYDLCLCLISEDLSACCTEGITADFSTNMMLLFPFFESEIYKYYCFILKW